MTARTISILSQKGGVGKTTTASALAAGLFLAGKKTLLLDLDPQSNLTFSFGIREIDDDNLFKAFMQKNVFLHPVRLRESDSAVLDLLPSVEALATLEGKLQSSDRFLKLRKALKKLSNSYDYIIIDTPPALGLLSLNALAASDSFLIPVLADDFGLQGTARLLPTFKAVRTHTNPDLKLLGVLITNFNSRTKLSSYVRSQLQKLADSLGCQLFTPIRCASAVKEAQMKHQTLFEYAPKSTAASDYKELIETLLHSEIK